MLCDIGHLQKWCHTGLSCVVDAPRSIIRCSVYSCGQMRLLHPELKVSANCFGRFLFLCPWSYFQRQTWRLSFLLPVRSALASGKRFSAHHLRSHRVLPAGTPEHPYCPSALNAFLHAESKVAGNSTSVSLIMPSMASNMDEVFQT